MDKTMKQPIAVFHTIANGHDLELLAIDHKQLELMVLIARVGKMSFYIEWD